MSKLLARAKAKLDGAQFYKTKLSVDDAYLDSMCFETQQGLDLALKALVELNGSRYVENHDIRAQLNLLDKLGVETPHEQELRNMAITINSWETESRYKDSFVAAVSEVDTVFGYAMDIIRFAETFVKSDVKCLDAFR